MILKKLRLLIFVCAILLPPLVKAQHNELSFNLTPHWLSGPSLDNNILVQGKDQFAGLGGVSYGRFTASGLGLRAGFNLGYFRPKFVVNSNAMDGFNNQMLGSVVMYNSLSLEPVYRFSMIKSQFELFGGADLRYFHSNGYTSYGYHFMESASSEFSVFEIKVPPYSSKFQSNFYGGFTYVKALNATNRISISLIKNVGLSKPGGGRFVATADNGNMFQTSFKPLTDFTGIRVQYGYNVERKERPGTPAGGSIRQSVFLEALGSGGLYSFNYDRRFKSGNGGLGARAGVGGGWLYSTDEPEGARYVSFPVLINYIVGKGRSGLETGIGVTPNVAFTRPVDDPGVMVVGMLNLGYRLQPLKKGFMMRAMWTPVFDEEGFYGRWAGLSVGYSFK